MSRVTKPSNPKDTIGSTKLPVHLVPDTLVAYTALAFLEGALKYGRYNWRVAGVRFSVYWDAMERHRMKLCAGEWEDPVTKVPHLASMAACIAIILDSHVKGKLTDDRPPVNEPLLRLIDAMGANVAHLKEVFRDHNPYQYTIADGAGEEFATVTGRVPKEAARSGAGQAARSGAGRRARSQSGARTSATVSRRKGRKSRNDTRGKSKAARR